jgi:hypothetical protein
MSKPLANIETEFESSYFTFYKKGKKINFFTKNKLWGKYDGGTFQVAKIKKWYFLKEKNTPELNRWTTLLCIVIWSSFFLSLYILAKNHTSLMRNEGFGMLLGNCLKYLFTFGWIMFMTWIVVDLVFAEPFVQRLWRIVLTRRRLKLIVKLEKQKEIEIQIKNKAEGLLIIEFIEQFERKN